MKKTVIFPFLGVVGSVGISFVASIGKGYPFRIFALLRCGASVENCLLGSVPNPRNGKECEPMNGRKRTVQIKFRVTEEERAFIEQKMQLVPTRNMEAYLRKMAIDGYIIQIDHADIKAMTAEIQKIGVNVNQIAKRVNATGSVYQEDIEEIKEVLADFAGRKYNTLSQKFVFHVVLLIFCGAKMVPGLTKTPYAEI